MGDTQVVVVAGICNVEVTCPVTFPVEFTSSRFATDEIEVRVSGVGYNVALGLARLGSRVRLATFLSSDFLSSVIRRQIEANIGFIHISPCEDSPRSIVLYSSDGRRSVITDLRDVASKPQLAHLNPNEALVGARLLALGNIAANRDLIVPAQVRGIPIATDLQSIRSADDPHNVPFLRAADIVFMSNDNFIDREAELLQSCRAQNARAIIAIGLGSKGVLLHEPHSTSPVHLPAYTRGRVVNTSGAGDALFAAFLDGVCRGLPAVRALERAVVFAGAKVSAASRSEGHLESSVLDEETNLFRRQLESSKGSG